MQPYFLPYIGYFQLLEHCDVFVVYDDIKYTKRGWINRNRILSSGKPRMVSLPLARASDSLDVRDRTIAPEFEPAEVMRLFQESYRKSPYWGDHDERLAQILEYPNHNLFDFIANSIGEISEGLNITTDIVTSSTLGVDRRLRGQDRVLATCGAVGATEYVNPIGGLDLYDDSAFADHGISLAFLKSSLTPYPQFSYPWVEALSIIDAMMFVAPDDLTARVRSDYEIVGR